ncbi:MAG: hypothetical protein Kow0056_06840 [Coriobacteriia bacterium]
MSPSASYRLRRLRELTLPEIVDKARRRSADARRLRAQRASDEHEPTWAAEAPEGALARILQVPEMTTATEWLEPVCEQYLAHRFDVLGSGWVHVAYGMECAGLEGIRFDAGPTVSVDPQGAWLCGRVSEPNLKEARRIWSLVSEAHEPIDWHIDVRSGYRWPATAWYRDIEVAPARGADIKVPWEMARCHHLPQMAVLACWSDAAYRDRLAEEFRDQALDFVAANPPRFGVNWASAMDVAIRIVNWLVAFDFFRAAGFAFDEDFRYVFSRSVLEHARHICDNLEGDERFRGNHYLADITGLLFAAAYLPPSEETQSWWTFARDEVFAQIEEQFLPDGANYEASTGYHRLSAEMAFYAVALILGVEGEDSVPDGVSERLWRAAAFVRDTATPDGSHPRIGDDDSGRLLKLGVRFEGITREEASRRFVSLSGLLDAEAQGSSCCYWAEDHLDHRHILSAARSLFSGEAPGLESPEFLDGTIITMLAKRTRLPIPPEKDVASCVRIGSKEDFDRVCGHMDALGSGSTVRQCFEVGDDFDSPLELAGYPDFGLFIFRRGGFYLAVRCGPVGQNGLGGHAHNDQLGIVVVSRGEALATDPGSYLYTPLPERRNEYRSVCAHNAPRAVDREPASLGLDIFRLDDPRATCVYFGEHGFAGYHEGYGPKVWRVVDLGEHVVTVTDYSEDGTITLLPPGDGPPPSLGYGIRLCCSEDCCRRGGIPGPVPKESACDSPAHGGVST